MTTSSSTLSCGHQPLVTPARQTLRWPPLQCYAVGIIMALSAIGGYANGAIEVIKIGNPLFEPSEFASGSARNSRSFRDIADFGRLISASVSETLGVNHVHAENPGFSVPPLPGEPHEGPYNQETRRAFAARGNIQTDVVPASEASGRFYFSMLFAFVPSDNAPLGASPDGSLVPVIPNEIFPIETSLRILRNGSPFSGATISPDLPSLSSQGLITDENGDLRDFRDLNWSHYIFSTFLTGPAGTSRILGDWVFQNEFRDANGNGWDIINSFKVVSRRSRVQGDLSHNGELDMHDLDILTQNVAVDAINLELDMNDDGLVNVADIHYWVTDLKSTWIGDANLDGEFNSGDLVEVLNSGKFETDQLARWSEGDWNGDERFDSSDFIVALQDGGYEMGARSEVAAVPEPLGLILLALGLLGVGGFRKR